jgi:AraC-like DNA-binding protein
VSDADGTRLVVPDGCVDLIWGPSGAFVAGPDTGPMPVRVRAGDAFTGIRFKPGGVGDVFGVPVHALRDQRVPVADLGFSVSGGEFSTWRHVAMSGGEFSVGRHLAMSGGRLASMRAAVGARLRATAPADAAAPAIAEALRTGRTVGEVAWTLGFSERQLLRRSLASFGYGPKVLQRVVRFQRALKLARAGVAPAEVAVASGYADQAHLANEVKRLSGVTLTELRR